MDVCVVSQDAHTLSLELVGEDQTLVNYLRKSLYLHKDTLFACYHIKHTLVSNPILVLHAKSSPQKILQETVSKLRDALHVVHDKAKQL